MSTRKAPCCGALNPLDHDFECRFRKTQVPDTYFNEPEPYHPSDDDMGEVDDNGEFIVQPLDGPVFFSAWVRRAFRNELPIQSRHPEVSR